MTIRTMFQKISYLQYPLMMVALYYIFKPYITGFETIWEDYNLGLLFMGLSISFSTLQDTTKTQNSISRKVWQNPKKGKIALAFLGLTASIFFLFGMYGIFSSKSLALQNLSYGLIVMGIGIVGLLKTALEMFENHRLDKNPGVTVEKINNK